MHGRGQQGHDAQHESGVALDLTGVLRGLFENLLGLVWVRCGHNRNLGLKTGSKPCEGFSSC